MRRMVAFLLKSANFQIINIYITGQYIQTAATGEAIKLRSGGYVILDMTETDAEVSCRR